jgi:hypothetical protein
MTLTGWEALDQFLRTDPRDVGCERALEILDVYVDTLLAHGSEAAEERFAGVAVHLRACGPCGEDFTGLLAVAAELGG